MIEKIDMVRFMNSDRGDGMQTLADKINEIIDQVNLITKSLEGRQFYEQERK